MTTKKFSLVSDLHIDFPQPKFPYNLLEQDVIVAGDTSNGLLGLKFLQKLKNKGFSVYACDGNHEHYANEVQGRSAQETTARFREDHRRYWDNVEVPLVLANGWYFVDDERAWYHYMNDSRKGDITAYDVNKMAKSDFLFIREHLEMWKNHQRKGVVVTHTAPCTETLDPRFDGHDSNAWYYNREMRSLLEEYSGNIHMWCHGHTHSFADKVVEGVRVVCNPRGYPGENPDWKPFTIELTF